MIFKKKEIKEKEDNLSEKIYDLIQKPVITEKGTLVSNNSQVIFSVPMNAKKKMLNKQLKNFSG